MYLLSEKPDFGNIDVLGMIMTSMYNYKKQIIY